MEVKIVLGYLFGDEGKGVTVQWLCQKAINEGKKPVVVRFSGGPQAAHTINLGGIEHICSSFGSGVLLNVPTVYTSDVYIDPICLMNEYKVLKDKGVDPKLYYNVFCQTITPYDVINARNDSKVRQDGTCGKGLIKCFERKHNAFLIDDKIALEESRKELEKNQELEDLFISCKEKITNLFTTPHSIFDDCDVVIFEGTQGLLLDMDNGFFPHVTPSKVGLNGISKFWLDDAEVYLVTRSYLTRHGNGYTPQNEIHFYSEEHETNITNEFQGNFKRGLHDYSLFAAACNRHCLDNYATKYNIKFNLVMTHADSKFDDFDTMGILRMIDCCSSITFNHLYYNDSIYSDVKEYI